MKARERAVDAIQKQEVARVIDDQLQTLQDDFRSLLVQDEIRLLRHRRKVKRARLEFNLPILDDKDGHGPEEKQHGRTDGINISGTDKDIGEKLECRDVRRKDNKREEQSGKHHRNEKAQDLVNIGVAAAPEESETVFDIFFRPAQRGHL